MELVLAALIAKSYFWILFALPLLLSFIRSSKLYVTAIASVGFYWAVSFYLGIKNADGPVGFEFLILQAFAIFWIAILVVFKATIRREREEYRRTVAKV